MNDTTPAQTGRLQILRLPEVCDVTGLCRSMVYQLESEHRFPKRIKIGMRAVGWVAEEIQEWLEQQVTKSRRERTAA